MIIFLTLTIKCIHDTLTFELVPLSPVNEMYIVSILMKKMWLIVTVIIKLLRGSESQVCPILQATSHTAKMQMCVMNLILVPARTECFPTSELLCSSVLSHLFNSQSVNHTCHSSTYLLSIFSSYTTDNLHYNEYSGHSQEPHPFIESPPLNFLFCFSFFLFFQFTKVTSFQTDRDPRPSLDTAWLLSSIGAITLVTIAYAFSIFPLKCPLFFSLKAML